MQDGLTGNQLIKKLNLFDDDILSLVTGGLQPYGKFWKPQYPPGSEDYLRQIIILTKRNNDIESQFPSIQSAVDNYDEWRNLYITSKKNSEGKFENVKFPGKITAKLIIRYNHHLAQIDKLQKKCSWKNYKPPQKDKDKESTINLLLKARYKMEDIDELETSCTKNIQSKKQISSEESNVQTLQSLSQQEADAFVRSSQISYISNSEIRIKLNSKNAKAYDYKDIGFKRDTEKPWLAFIGMLRDRKHSFEVGKSYRSEYSKNQKTLDRMNDKLIKFLSKNFGKKFPDKFKVTELDRSEKAGTYKLKFISDASKRRDKVEEKYGQLNDEELLSEMELLAISMRQTDDDEKRKKLQDKVITLLDIASDRGISDPDLKKSLSPTSKQ